MNAPSRILVASLGLAAVSSAQAVLLDVAGTTTGSFGFTQNAGGLSYQGGSFSALLDTDSGAISLGNSASLTSNSLGLFRLTNVAGSPDKYAGTFSLTIRFTTPITSPNAATYSASLSGSVTNVTSTSGLSTVKITFDDTDGVSDLTAHKSFDYVAADGTRGTMVFGLNRQYNLGYANTGLSSQVGVSGDLSATAAPVPEPSALGVLGIGVVAAIRRRRSK